MEGRDMPSEAPENVELCADACNACWAKRCGNGKALSKCPKCKMRLYYVRACLLKDWTKHKVICPDSGEVRLLRWLRNDTSP